MTQDLHAQTFNPDPMTVLGLDASELVAALVVDISLLTLTKQD